MSIEYLNNKVFEELIASFKKSKKRRKRNQEEFDKIQRILADAFYVLAENIIRAFKFQMIDRDDMLQEGVMICFDKLGRFDPDYRTSSGVKSRAFNYFTTCVLNHYRQLYRTAKKIKQLNERYFEFLCRKNSEKVVGFISDHVRREDE